MSRMLEPAGLDESSLSTTLGSMMKGGVDYADLYFQVSRNESWSLEDGIIREGSFNLDQGVGVRATSGEKTGFAYSDELLMPAPGRAPKSLLCIRAMIRLRVSTIRKRQHCLWKSMRQRAISINAWNRLLSVSRAVRT
jgi:TldD protein